MSGRGITEDDGQNGRLAGCACMWVLTRARADLSHYPIRAKAFLRALAAVAQASSLAILLTT